MKVIGAGFGRTGTLSTKLALEQLGFGPCYHMKEVFANPEHIHTWAAAVAEQTVDWQAFFAGYQSTTDWPGCEYYRELMEIYPEAKVLLNVRDPEKWYASTRGTIYPLTQLLPTLPSFMHNAQLSQGEGMPKLKDLLPMIDVINEMIWQGGFQGQFEDRQKAIDIFNQHIEEVKAHVPADRLLVFNVKEGWEPLCEFLGVPVPQDKPFPRVNDGETIKKRLKTLRLLKWLPTVVFGLLVTVVLYLIWRGDKPK